MGRAKGREKSASDPAYGALLALAVVAVLLLVPLRGLALSVAPPMVFLAALVLFVVPGAVLARLLSREVGDGLDLPASAPVAFTLSVGLFGLLALPFLVLKWSLNYYLLVCGAVLALSLVGLLLLALRPRGSGDPTSYRARGTARRAVWPLWALLAALMAIAAVASVNVFHRPNGDLWALIGFVRGFSETGGPEGAWGRYALNGWLFEQAALARVTGLDPVFLVQDYLTPTIVVLSFLAFYWLARTLFGSETAALLAACGAGLFYLTHIDYTLRAPGSELISRSVEDKYVARFLFLPVALGLAVLHVRTMAWRYLLLFAFVCCSVVAVHPMGLGLIGLSLAGFALVHLTLNFRNRRAWIPFATLGGAMLSIVAPPAVYLLATGSPYISQLEGTHSVLSSEYLASSQNNEQVMVLGDYYIMHPSFLLDPAMLAAFLVGVPFLLWRVRGGVAAQLLLGTLLLTTLVLYFPPVSTLVAGVIGPWSLWRLTWPTELAALLVLGWAAWELLSFLVGRLSATRVGRAAALLPALCVVALMAVAAPNAVAGIRSVSAEGEAAQGESNCMDPVFRHLGETAGLSGSIVLAPDAENSCFAAYAPNVGYVSYRGVHYGKGPNVPQHVADVRRFFGSPTVDEEMLGILDRYNANLVLLHADSPLNAQLRHLPGFTPTPAPGDRYRLYAFDPQEPSPDLLTEANGSLNAGDFEESIEAYAAALGGSEAERFLAYLGLGRAYLGLGRPEVAVQAFDAAAGQAPNEAEAHALLAEAWVAAEDLSEAREAQEKAVSLAPRSMELRFRLVAILQELGEERAAVGEMREVVSMYPDVPEYRARLGGALARAGDAAAAEREFDRAVALNPLSPLPHQHVAEANEEANRLQAAAAGYERALDMAPENKYYAFKQGHVYYQLATSGKEDTGGYFDLAEENLRSAAEAQGFGALEDPQRANAYFLLGNLYGDRGRDEEAINAYRSALDLNPDLEQARARMERLRRER